MTQKEWTQTLWFGGAPHSQKPWFRDCVSVGDPEGSECDLPTARRPSGFLNTGRSPTLPLWTRRPVQQGPG